MTPVATPAPATASIPFSELVAHRAYLVNFARRRLADPLLAEDAVHDVFEAVFTGRARFAGRAAPRTWLTAVLKNKLVDLVRRRPAMESLDEDGGHAEASAPACPSAGPDERAEQRELLRQALERIEALPASLRDVMRLRVLEDQGTADVCRTLGISEENLFVRLHRARRQLLS